MKSQLSILVATILISGCGSLNVELSVLNPDFVETVREQATLRAELKDALFESNSDVSERYTALRLAHRRVYEEIAETYTNEAAGLNEAARQSVLDIAASQVPSFDTYIAPKYVEMVQSVNNVDSKIRDEFHALDVGAVDLKFLVEGRLAVLLNQKRSLEQSFRAEVARDTDQAVSDRLDETDADVSQVIVAAESVDQSSKRLFDNQLYGSPLAYAIASAPKDAWEAKLNRAFGRGQFGNMNIAIKLGREDEVFGRDFTVKGLTFDPSNVASIASKVTTQSMLLAAQIAGVPLASSSTDAARGSDSLVTSSNALNQLQSKQAERQARFDDAERALLLIGRVLMSESGKMSSDNSAEVRADAVSAFVATYDAHKARLDVSQTQ